MLFADVVNISYGTCNLIVILWVKTYFHLRRIHKNFQTLNGNGLHFIRYYSKIHDMRGNQIVFATVATKQKWIIMKY